MKTPRFLSNRLGMWIPLALLVLPVLAARTLIVASEEPGANDGPTRFVISDDGSKTESVPQPGLLAPDAIDDAAAHFDTVPPVPFAQQATIQEARPAFQEETESMWRPDEGHAAPSAEQAPDRSVQQAMPAASFSAQGFVEPPPLFQESAQSVVQQAYNPFDENGIGSLPLAETMSGPAATQFTVQVPEERVARLLYQEDTAPPSTEAPEVPPAPIADVPVPTDDARQIPAETDIPMSPSPSDETAPPVPPTPYAPEPEASQGNSYGLMSENEMFYQPDMPADCGMACPLTWYARAEMMYVQRVMEDGITLTDNDYDGLDRFEHTPGGRITIGRIGDCLDGLELVYTGGFEWTERSRIVGDNLNPKFASDRFDISAFRKAQVHTQEYRSDFHSAELNRKWWGWDVISTTIGLRYMYVGEKYRFDSLNLDVGTGSLKMAMDNHYFGPQLGLDLYRPIGRWTTELRSKAGVFVNYIEYDYNMVNAGVPQFSTGSEKGQFGFEAELGLYAKYQLLPRVHLQAGYEFWYLYGVATPHSQNRERISRDDGAYSKDDIFYHGGSVGVEMVW